MGAAAESLVSRGQGDVAAEAVASEQGLQGCLFTHKGNGRESLSSKRETRS